MNSTTQKLRRTSKIKLLFLQILACAFFNYIFTDECQAPLDIAKEKVLLKTENKLLQEPKIKAKKNKNKLKIEAEPLDFSKKEPAIEEKIQLEVEEPKFNLNFENAAVKNVLDYVAGLLNVTFFSDDFVFSEKKSKGISDLKVTFKTNRPFVKLEILNFIDLILEIADLGRTQMPGVKDTFRITNIINANKSNLPTFIGIDYQDLPNEGRIRYVYFFANRPVNQLAEIIKKLQSRTGQINTFPDSNAMIFTDNASNIKYLMSVIKIMDSKDLPEVLSILKLKNADAGEVAKLYETLKGKDDIFNPFAEKKGPKLTQSLKVITDPRTNALILFGPRDNVAQIEKFIIEHVDIELQDIPAKMFTHKLNYVPAEQVAKILSAVVAYGSDTEAAKFGGMKGGEKYLSGLTFEADKQGNNIIVRGNIEDYNLVKSAIEELDKPQRQVAVEVLLVAMNLDDNRELQNQIRNKNPGKLEFQLLNQITPTVVTDAGRLTGNLLQNVVNGNFVGLGWNIFSLGKSDAWSLLDVLQFPTRTNTLAHPFLVATNKYTASVSIGTKRLVTIGNIVSSGSETPEQDFVEASTTVKITPQINSLGVINLDVDILIEQFTSPDPSSPNRSIQKIRTNASVAENEILALGGLIEKTRVKDEVGLPIIGRIPIIGSLFRGKISDFNTDSLMIFICPKIIKPHTDLVTGFTKTKVKDVENLFAEMDSYENPRDPISRWFFQEPNRETNIMVNDFIFKNTKTPANVNGVKADVTETTIKRQLKEAKPVENHDIAKVIKADTVRNDFKESFIKDKSFEDKTKTIETKK